MKSFRLLNLTIALMAVFYASAQTTQTGIVQEYNEKAKKTPLAGVELNVRSANTTASDKDGKFSLQFLTLKPGEKVNVRRIEKLGYEIFNKEAVDSDKMGLSMYLTTIGKDKKDSMIALYNEWKGRNKD